LHFVTRHSFGNLRRELFGDEPRIRNPAVETPPDVVQFADDGVLLVFEKALDGNLDVSVGAHGGRVVAARRVKQIFRFDFNRNFLKSRVAVARLDVEG